MDVNEIMLLLGEINGFSVAVRMMLSMVIGGILGVERGYRNRPAGFKTHMLVCMGSAMVMMTGQYTFETFQASDPSRLAAQVVSGIGFLGAGTIMVTKKSQVKGLTTAAGLWTAAGLGLAVGIGFYEGAVIGAISVLFVMVVMYRMDSVIKKRSRVIHLYAEYGRGFQLRLLSEQLQTAHCEMFDVQVSVGKKWKMESNTLFFTVKMHERIRHELLLDLIGEVEGVSYIEEI